MSENIEIGFASKSIPPCNFLFNKISEIIKENMEYEIFSMADWTWSDIQNIKENIDEDINNDRIVVYQSLNKQINIGMYAYKFHDIYLSEMWISEKLLDEKNAEKMFDDLCGQAFNEIENYIYAYIGVETFIHYSSNYEEMIKESTGIIKWSFNDIKR